jgi:hypothetical protein
MESMMMQKLFDACADRWGMDDLQRNTRKMKSTSVLGLLLLFMPGLLFLASFWILKDVHPRFAWVNDFSQYPWQFWGIGLTGIIATLGGVCDWLFHKVYVTVGPNEHHSHILGLGAGGVVFVLMALASIADQPLYWLLPVIVALLVTVTLICYDEFAFHVRRCKPFETRLHRMLVFGNGAAFLIWMHWIFVAGVIHAGT